MSDRNKLIVTAIVALLIGLLLGFLIWGGGNDSANVADGSQEDEMTDDSMSQENGSENNSSDNLPAEEQAGSTSSLEAVDQAPGRNVSANATLDGSAWVVVREDAEGEMGNILGAKYVSGAGEHKVVVPLLRETVEGGKYYVLIYQDDGDREFDHNKDSALVDTAVEFSAVVESGVEVEI